MTYVHSMRDARQTRMKNNRPVSPSDAQGDQAREWTDIFDVLVICESDRRQRELLDRLTREGYQCRALVA